MGLFHKDATEINERTDASGWKVMHCSSMLFKKPMTGRGRESVGPGTIARSLPGQTIRKKTKKKLLILQKVAHNGSL